MPARMAAQATPEPQAIWALTGLQLGFCIDFLMDSAMAAKEVRKVDKDYHAVPASDYVRLNPALASHIERRPEFATWIPASLCIIGADTVAVGNRISSDEDPDERQMVGFWGIAATAAEQSGADSVMVVPVLFTNNHRIARNSELGGLKIDTVEEDRGDMPDTPGDQFYEVRVKKVDLYWAGHMAGTPAVGEPRRWTLKFKGNRNSSWMATVNLAPGQEQFVVGSLRIQGKDDLAEALKGSPMRMQGPAFWLGSASFEFYPG